MSCLALSAYTVNKSNVSGSKGFYCYLFILGQAQQIDASVHILYYRKRALVFLLKKEKYGKLFSNE